MIAAIKERVGEVLAMMARGGDDPVVTESRAQTDEMKHRLELSTQMLRDVDKSLDLKRTGFYLSDLPIESDHFYEPPRRKAQ